MSNQFKQKCQPGSRSDVADYNVLCLKSMRRRPPAIATFMLFNKTKLLGEG